MGLSGRDLPAAQALSGHASVVARAGLYEASGAFPGQTPGSLQALAYLLLLNGASPPSDAIAFARTAAAAPPGSSGTDAGDPGNDPDPAEPEDGNLEDADPENAGAASAADAPRRRTAAGIRAQIQDRAAAEPDDSPGPDGGPGPEGDDGSDGPVAQPVLPEVTVPLATLLGQAERARGEPACSARSTRP